MAGFAVPPAPAGLEPGPRPTFAVVVAAYRAASTVGAAVRSALDQTEPPAELVVVDDGSDDDVAGALAEFGDAVRLLRRRHAGEAATKNAGVAATSAPWVVLLDADDTWAPRRLERLADLAGERPDLDLLSTDAWFVVDGERGGRFHGPHHPFGTTDQVAELLRRDYVFAHAAVRRTAWDRVGGFDVGVTHAADWDCWLRLLLTGSRAGCVVEPLADYTIHGASLSADRSTSLANRVEVIDRVLARYPLTPSQCEAAQAMRAESLRRSRQAAAEQALLSGAPARGPLWRCATAPGLRPRARARALADAALPERARRRVRAHLARTGRPSTSRALPPGGSPGDAS